MKNKINQRAQIAIWVILALILVAVILLFALVQKMPTATTGVELDVESYLEKCAALGINDAVNLMLPQGGFLSPKNFKLYNNTNVSYLCLHTGYFKPCVNQHPMLITEMNKEIESYIRPRIEKCFEDLKNEAESKGGAVEMGEMNFSIAMAPGKILTNIERNLKFTMNEDERIFEGFSLETLSPAYDLASVAVEIMVNEAKYCAFLTNGYMLTYPRWDIRITMMSDFTKIYAIKDKSSGEIMNIAIRSCAMPPGMGI